jgi:hypothetical protein
MFDGYEDMKPKVGFMEYAYRKIVGVKHGSSAEWDQGHQPKVENDGH